MPNLLAIRQSRNLFNFGQYKLFIDYIFYLLHTEAVFKVPVAETKAEKLLYNFVYVSRAITSTLMAIAQNEIYQQIVNGLFPVAWRPGGGGEGGTGPSSDNFLGALKSKGGAKIHNCQCEISYKICPACQQIQSGSNSGISIAIQ